MILALDGSTKSTGQALFDENKNLITYGCWTATSANKYKRMKKIITKLKNFLIQYSSIKTIVLEEVRPATDYTSNIKTFKALMQFQAAIEFLLFEDFNGSIETFYFLPSEWRKYCKIEQGKGILREELKKQDISFAKEQQKIEKNINDDMADAICIGQGFFHKDKQQEEDITKTSIYNRPSAWKK